MKTTDWRVAVRDLSLMQRSSLLGAATFLLVGTPAFADGCFVFQWDKQKDINEPTQKAIILHDRNREDLVLQVKYEGPAEDFGWLVPVPGQPEVRKGTMEPFYELSRLTQESSTYHLSGGTLGADSVEQELKIIDIKTVGAYEVAILASTSPSALANWLGAHHFSFPKEKWGVLEQYIQRRWFFVAARIHPNGNGFVVKSAVGHPSAISASTRKELATGELHPIIISFPSEKCVFPLAISAVNGSPSEVSLYVLSAEPLVSSVIFDRKLTVYRSEKDKWAQARGSRRKLLEDMRMNISADSPLAARMKAEDPGDPPPPSVFNRTGLGVPEPWFPGDLEEDFYSSRFQPVWSMRVKGDADGLKGSRQDLPRLSRNRWWLTKVVETFRPEEMVDLEFRAALPFLAGRIRRADGEAAAHCLPQYDSLAVPTVLGALRDPDVTVGGRGLLAAAEMRDPAFVGPLLHLLDDQDPKTKMRACSATEKNWNQEFVTPLMRLLGDSDRGVAQTAQYCLRRHLSDIDLDAVTLRKMMFKDGPASVVCYEVLRTRGQLPPQADLVRLFGSTNLALVSSVFTPLRNKLQLEELTPLMTNSLPLARMMALGVLARRADKPAVDRIVSRLRDPNEAIRWRVRSTLRRLTGQKLGADPAAYEKWWAANKDTYMPIVTQPRASSVP